MMLRPYNSYDAEAVWSRDKWISSMVCALRLQMVNCHDFGIDDRQVIQGENFQLSRPRLNIKTVFPGKVISIIKRRRHARLFDKGKLYTDKHIYIETSPVLFKWRGMWNVHV